MKLRALFAGMSLLAMAGVAPMDAQQAPVVSPAAPSPPADTTKTVDTPAQPDASKSTGADTKKAPAPAKKKEEPPAKVDGLVISRPNGAFLGLQVLNNNFVLTFYNAKKKKVAPDVVRATVRWPVKYQPGPEQTVLNPSGGFSLASEKTVRPPLVFIVHISLFVEGNDEAVESYTVNYHGE
jgi:hypothetical protein